MSWDDLVKQVAKPPFVLLWLRTQRFDHQFLEWLRSIDEYLYRFSGPLVSTHFMRRAAPKPIAAI